VLLLVLLFGAAAVVLMLLFVGAAATGAAVLLLPPFGAAAAAGAGAVVRLPAAAGAVPLAGAAPKDDVTRASKTSTVLIVRIGPRMTSLTRGLVVLAKNPPLHTHAIFGLPSYVGSIFSRFY
jgi:hypothetical protein